MCGILALLFLIVPATEIYVIIKVGGLLGALPTLALVALTAIVGAALVKRQGTKTLQKLQGAMANGRGAAKIIAESVLILVAGVTLLAPGFITDIVGIALLLPPIRSYLAGRMVEKMKSVPIGGMAGMPGGFAGNAGAPGSNGEGGEPPADPPPPGVIDV
ncbi:MAG: FxsA family protein [Kofleriaceae bacterium]|nr:FxsA family protein [Kofleriaceae bacterium]